MARYNNPAIKQLKDQQVRYAPIEQRLVQVNRAEQVVARLDPDTTYSYQDLCEWVTDFRPQSYPDLEVSGADAVHDLRCFVEDLSDSANIEAESAAEPVLTVDEVSERYNVSTKTVDRWRDRGLCSRKFKFGKRKRVGFLESSVVRFVKEHADEVRRGSTFSQLDDGEKGEIVRRARRLARYGGCPSEVSRRIAKRLGRSPETIRYTLKNFDKENPDLAVFPNASEPLSDEQRTEIFHAVRRGVPVERIADKFCRTKASVYRIVSEVRATRLLDQPIEFMDSPEFHEKDADKVILGPPPETEKKGTAKAPPGLPPYLASLYTIPLLTREDEQYYFRKMNYLKFKADRLREKIDPQKPRTKEMNEVERLIDGALDIKNFLIRSNLRLVVSIAKRHIKPSSNFFEMVSDGNMSLIRAIEKFDYTKGNKFSTYASWAIMKNFARSIPQEHRQLDRFRTGHEELFGASQDERGNQFREEINNRGQNEAINQILGHLDEREQDIIRYRFGLEEGSEPETLEQVGHRFGVTKERIRQLEHRALAKMRKIAQEAALDIPGI